MSWLYVGLGNGVEASAPTKQIQEAFRAAFIAARGPIGMALFSHLNPDDANVTLYFSPAASAFAAGVRGAALCERPKRNGLSLLAGDQRCLSVLFPDV